MVKLLAERSYTTTLSVHCKNRANEFTSQGFHSTQNGDYMNAFDA